MGEGKGTIGYDEITMVFRFDSVGPVQDRYMNKIMMTSLI